MAEPTIEYVVRGGPERGVEIRRGEPASMEHAIEERQELAAYHQALQVTIGKIRGRRCAEQIARESDLRDRLSRTVQRLRYVKQWIKDQNRLAALASRSKEYGADLDDPTVLIAALRGIILRERKAGRMEWDDADPTKSRDRCVLDAATQYVQEVGFDEVEPW